MSLFYLSFLLMVSFNVIFPLMISLFETPKKVNEKNEMLRSFSADFKKICRAAKCLQQPYKSFNHSIDPGIFLLHELTSFFCLNTVW